MSASFRGHRNLAMKKTVVILLSVEITLETLNLERGKSEFARCHTFTVYYKFIFGQPDGNLNDLFLNKKHSLTLMH